MLGYNVIGEMVSKSSPYEVDEVDGTAGDGRIHLSLPNATLPFWRGGTTL